MFDGSRHGYNPEYDLGSVPMAGHTGRVEFRWPSEPCRDPVFVVCLSHQFEEALDHLQPHHGPRRFRFSLPRP